MDICLRILGCLVFGVVFTWAAWSEGKTTLASCFCCGTNEEGKQELQTSQKRRKAWKGEESGGFCVPRDAVGLLPLIFGGKNIQQKFRLKQRSRRALDNFFRCVCGGGGGCACPPMRSCPTRQSRMPQSRTHLPHEQCGRNHFLPSSSPRSWQRSENENESSRKKINVSYKNPLCWKIMYLVF